MPRAAFEDPFDPQPSSFEGTVFVEGCLGVVGTGGIEAAAVTEVRGNGDLIEFDQLDQEFR